MIRGALNVPVAGFGWSLTDGPHQLDLTAIVFGNGGRVVIQRTLQAEHCCEIDQILTATRKLKRIMRSLPSIIVDPWTEMNARANDCWTIPSAS